MFNDILESFGLSKNEAKIYITLLREGESSVGIISPKSKIHRRNVYDVLDRLTQRGLVVEIIENKEKIYKAVAPSKLKEILALKQKSLEKIMPDLENLYKSTNKSEEVSIYKGIEGLKIYMQDVLETKQDVYTIGGAGIWASDNIKDYFDQFKKEAEKLGIKFYTIYDFEVQKENRKILHSIKNSYKILPKIYSTDAAIDIFGDHVVILSKSKSGEIDEDYLFTVMLNQRVADAFRVWFKLIWDSLKE